MHLLRRSLRHPRSSPKRAQPSYSVIGEVTCEAKMVKGLGFRVYGLGLGLGSGKRNNGGGAVNGIAIP